MTRDLLRHAGRYKLISFDLFDTLVGRRYAYPNAVFKQLASAAPQLGYPGLSAELRAAAEFSLRQRHGFAFEVTLEEIYAEIAHRLATDPTALVTMRELELTLERDALYGLPLAVAMVGDLVKAGKRVILTSDTYLPRSFITEFVDRIGVPLSPDRCYLSSDTRLLKSSGEQFGHVLRQENIAPHEMLHIGDNLESDVAQPRRLGIHACHYAPTAANRYEHTLAPDPGAPLVHQRLSGELRCSRLTASPGMTHADVVRNVACGVAGPLLVGFVAWCLATARSLGYRRLYFVSRDGQILYRIARRLASDEAIELRYLHGSRQAWHLPGLQRVEDGLDWIMAPTWHLTPAIILQRVSIAPETIADALATSGFPASTWHRRLDDQQRERFAAVLCAAPIAAVILAQARQAASTALAYFDQEGLTDATSNALVDIGWNGRLQRSMHRILAGSAPEVTIGGLYFGLANRFRYREQDQLHALFGDEYPLDELWKLGYVIPLLEIFVAADHGRVTGYQSAGGRVSPRLASPRNELGLQWGLEAQQDGILAATDAFLAAGLREWSQIKPLFRQFVANFSLLTQAPDRLEAAAYGSWWLAEDQNESYHMKLARPFSALSYARWRATGVGRDHNEWLQASDVLTGTATRRLAHRIGKIQATGLTLGRWVRSYRTTWQARPPDSDPRENRVLVNIGCGRHFHAEWINLDVVPASEGVRQHDLRLPLPFADGTCDVVYHSHVIEHLTPDEAAAFVADCYRVLKPGGIMRVVAPDLETICRLYLRYLDDAASGIAGAEAPYDWMVIELLDQLVRHESGGTMLRYWMKDTVPAEDFVVSRVGWEGTQVIKHFRQLRRQGIPVEPPPPAMTAESVGSFRVGGEVHRWMYDRFSLRRLLEAQNFAGVSTCQATESRIAGFARYRLDVGADGNIRKPDSFFMECVRPER